MRVLVACEESQEVCKAFRALGHEAYSCDIQECSGGHPEWHIQCDALELLKMRWDLIIAHPPCTYLSAAGAGWLYNADHSIKSLDRLAKGREAAAFFLAFLNADCGKIAVENPRPMKIFELPKASQYIEPYMFGDAWLKRTLLWLRGLPPLRATDVVAPKALWCGVTTSRKGNRKKSKYELSNNRTSKKRAKTFPGIARAMAEQWGGQA